MRHARGILAQQASQVRGCSEDIATLSLSHDLGKVGFGDAEAIPPQDVGIEGWAESLANGR